MERSERLTTFLLIAYSAGRTAAGAKPNFPDIPLPPLPKFALAETTTGLRVPILIGWESAAISGWTASTVANFGAGAALAIAATSGTHSPAGPSVNQTPPGKGGSDTEATGLNDRLIPPHELVTRRITVPARSRGVTSAICQYLRAVARRWGYTGSIDAAHANTAHVFTEPGDTVVLRPQASSINRAEGADIARAAASRRVLSDPRVPVRPKK